MTDMTQKLESMRTSLDDSRLSNQTLKSTRPTIRFLGYTSKAPWEVLSLQERLWTVEQAFKGTSKQLAATMVAYMGL